jgi:hypothetical protein
MRWIVSLAAAVAFVGATACDAAGYAIVSLIGGELTVVGAQPVGSTSLDRNSYASVAVPDAAFDRAVFDAVDRVVLARNRRDTTSLLRMPVADARAAFVDGSNPGHAVALVVAAVRPAVVQAGLERLVIVAPYRYAPMMATRDGHVGTGRVAGLGVYVDRMTWMEREQSGDAHPGYLGLFANFRVLIVDVRNGTVLADDFATTGTTYSATQSNSRDPMTAISAEEKVRVLQWLVDREIARILPPLLVKADP